MKKKIVIYGTTDFSKELRFYIEENNTSEVVAYVLDEKYITEATFDDRDVLPYERLEDFFSKSEIEILISLGYSKMNDNRKATFHKCQNDGWQIASYIHPSVTNLSKSMGIGNIIMDNVDLRFNTVIGNGNIILTRTVIAHETSVGDFNYFAGSNHINGHNQIGNNNFLGTNCMLTDGGYIGNYNLIGAGTCLSKKIEDNILVTPAAVRVTKTNKRAMDIFLMNKL